MSRDRESHHSHLDEFDTLSANLWLSHQYLTISHLDVSSFKLFDCFSVFFSLSILSFPRSLFPSFCSTGFFSFNSFFNVNHGLNQAATGHKYLYTNSFVTKTKWRTFNRTFWLYVCSLQYLLHYRTWYVMLTYPSMSCCSIFHLLIPKPPLKSRSVRNKFVRALCILLCFS